MFLKNGKEENSSYRKQYAQRLGGVKNASMAKWRTLNMVLLLELKVERTVMARKSEKNFKARIYHALNPKLRRFHFFLYSMRSH